MRRSDLLLRAVLLTTAVLAASCNGDNLGNVSAPTGSLKVVTTTTGGPPDPDGYTIQIDEGQPQPIGVNASYDTTGLPTGTHSVTLAGLAANCSVSGDNPRTLSVSDTGASIEFQVSCQTVSSALEITTVTTGESLDPDSFAVSIDGGAPRPIGTSGSITLSPIAPGSYTVALSGVASNCTPAEGSSQSVTVPMGEPAAVRFTVTCSFIGITIWKTIPLPTSVSALEGSGRTLWGTSPSDLFVVAQTDLSSHHNGIWHYDGSEWTEQATPPDMVTSGLWGFSSTDVYAVGYRELDGPPAAEILHYDGSRWSEMPGPIPDTPGVDGSYNAIWGPTPQDVFITGTMSTGSPPIDVLGHFDGSAWSKMEIPVLGNFPYLTDMAGSSGTDVWVIGTTEENCPDCIHGIVLHYDGHGWTEKVGNEGDEFDGVWAIAPNDVWVVGVNGPGNANGLHFDGSSWNESELKTEGRSEPPLDVWASSHTDVYAVGKATVLHYDGSSWTRISKVGGDKVWGTSRQDVFILQEHAVLHGSP